MLRCRIAVALVVGGLGAAGCGGGGAASSPQVTVGDVDAVVTGVTCDDDPVGADVGGDILPVGEVVFTATARTIADDGRGLEVALVRVEVTDDAGDPVVTHDGVTVTTEDGGWEGWTTQGSGADAFTSPLDDVVAVQVQRDGDDLQLTGDVAVLDESGLPTRQTVALDATLTCPA